MSWVRIVAPPCTCAERPILINAICRQGLIDKGITVGSQWQCDMPDCNKVWEIVQILSVEGIQAEGWTWRRIQTPTGGSLE